ncbi:MAG: response regulator transcription factor [Ruminococcus sp.]|nr:response regulator transcription factor [Ruminococcus sp.]
MRIAICDDEARYIEDLKGKIQKLYNSLDIVIDEFLCGEDLLKSFRHKDYDVIFLDIEMQGLDGITVARRLREVSDEVSIVFLTGHIEYAVKGYEVNALRYLTKPADEEKVREVIEHLFALQNKGKLLWVKTTDGEQKIKLTDILFIESQNQNVVINTADESFSVRGNISDYEKKLAQDGFFRIHRSYLISLQKVMRIGSREVVMEDDTSLPVSRNKEAELKKMLFSYVKREAF